MAAGRFGDGGLCQTGLWSGACWRRRPAAAARRCLGECAAWGRRIRVGARLRAHADPYAPVYARAQLRIVEQAERLLFILSRFGAPDGVVVGARRDTWQSDGVLRDGSSHFCWCDLQNAAAQQAMLQTATAALQAPNARITAFRTSRATHIEAPYSTTQHS